MPSVWENTHHCIHPTYISIPVWVSVRLETIEIKSNEVHRKIFKEVTRSVRGSGSKENSMQGSLRFWDYRGRKVSWEIAEVDFASVPSTVDFQQDFVVFSFTRFSFGFSNHDNLCVFIALISKLYVYDLLYWGINC